MKTITVFEQLYIAVKAHPNFDQVQLAEIIGKTRSHVSACVTLLEHHKLIGHRLVQVNDTDKRHRGYFTIDGGAIKHKCSQCGGRLYLYGFHGEQIVQKCSECGHRVVLS